MLIRSPLRTAALCGAMLLLAAASAPAATLQATPGRIGAVLRTAQPGDVVQLRAGTYRDDVTVPAFTGDVTIRACPGEKPILVTPTFTGGRHLRLQGLDLRGIVVRDTDDLTVTESTITVGGAMFYGTDRLTVSANTAHDAWDGFVFNDAMDVTFTDNQCWSIPTASRASGGDCVQLARTHRFTILRNVFRDQPIKPHVDAVEAICGNTDGLIAYNRFSNVRGIVVTPGDNTPGVPQDRFTIVNNLFAKTRTFAFNGVVMRDSKFLHNTGPDGGYVQIGGVSSRWVVAGNIMRQFLVDPARAAQWITTEDYNLMASVRAGYRKGGHSTIGAATFVNAAAGDYRLAPGSTGIGAGTLSWMPSDDLYGTVRTLPDLGAIAYER